MNHAMKKMHQPESLTCRESWNLLANDPNAMLVDVRTKEEWQSVGAPDLSSIGKEAVLLSWKTNPGYALNENFLRELAQRAPNQDAKILFLCRSGGRSYDAATAALEAGYRDCVNLVDGFEGEPNASGERCTVSGWRAANLPWRNA